MPNGEEPIRTRWASATSTEAVSSNTVITLATTGDALNGTDYTLSSTTLTISSGSKTGSITFTSDAGTRVPESPK